MCEKIDKLISDGSYDRALAAAKRLRNKKTAHKYLVWIYRMKGKPGAALRHLRKLEKNADNFCEEAVLLRMMCEFSKAREKISEAMKIYHHKKDREGLSFALWTKGGIERYGGRPLKGYEAFKKSLNLARDAVSKAYALCGLGGTGRLLGKIGESLRNYRKANRIFKKEKDVFGIAYSFCGMGSAYRMKRNFEKSKTLYKKAIALYGKIKDDWNRAYSMWGLAQTEGFLGRKKIAEKINSEAQKIFSRFKDPRGKFYCLIQKGNFERAAGNFEKARRTLEKCEGILEKLKLPYEKKLLEVQRHLAQKKEKAPILIP